MIFLFLIRKSQKTLLFNEEMNGAFCDFIIKDDESAQKYKKHFRRLKNFRAKEKFQDRLLFSKTELGIFQEIFMIKKRKQGGI